MKSSSKQSVKQDHDSKKIRLRIQSSQNRLNFVKWQILVILASIALVFTKLLFKSLYDSSVMELYAYELQINQITNLLRPCGFIFKESIKRWAVDIEAVPSAETRFNRILLLSSNVYYSIRLKTQIDQSLSFFSGDNMDTNFSFNPECMQWLT